MASQIVLYLSLAVILGVILTKFFLAVSFGWFFSWRLGNFKEGQSYAERMKRQSEIEDWSRNITTTGPIPKPYMNSQINLQNKKKSILPQTSRFTQPQNVMRFDAERGPSPYWKNTSTYVYIYIHIQYNFFFILFKPLTITDSTYGIACAFFYFIFL